MSEIMARERFLRSGKKVYEYSFEMASVEGKRKRKSKSGFASKRDARIAGRKALSEYENVGQVMVDRDISYANFLDLWMENNCKLTCKESTLYGYEKKIRLYLKPELGGYWAKLTHIGIGIRIVWTLQDEDIVSIIAAIIISILHSYLFHKKKI